MTTPVDLISDINNTLENELPKLESSLPLSRIEAIDADLSEIQGYIDDPLNNVGEDSIHRLHLEILSEYQGVFKSFQELESKALSAIRYIFERSLEYLNAQDPSLNLNDDEATKKAHEKNPKLSPAVGAYSMRVGLDTLSAYIDTTSTSRIKISEAAIVAEDVSDALNRYMNSPTVNEFAMIQRFQKGIETLESKKQVCLTGDIIKPLESFNFDDYWD